MKSALLQAHASGMEHVVFVFHSFSTVKPRDIFYSEFRPDHITIGRYRGLLRFLAEHPEQFTVLGMGDLAGREVAASTPVPAIDLGTAMPVARKAVQAVNRIYWI